jgi:hypothetical protein
MALDILGPANAPNSVTARPADDRLFGTNDTWFKDCTSPVANDGTKLKAAFMNSVAGMARALVRGNGNTLLGASIVAENNADDAMAWKSIQHLIQRGQPVYAVDTGGVNALAVALTPAAAEYKAGMSLRVKVAISNTSACTLNVNGLGAKAISMPTGMALSGGEMQTNSIVELVYDGVGFQLLAADIMAVVSSRKTKLVYSPGTYTWNCPPGITKVTVTGRGGGGGGGGSSGGTFSAGGGSGGSYFTGTYSVVPGTAYIITVGNGGAGGSSAGTTGGSGNATSFSSFATAPGGIGGPVANVGSSNGGAAPANASGGQLNWPGIVGGNGVATGSSPQGGTGGGSYGQSATNVNPIGGGGGISGLLPGVGGNGGGGVFGGGNGGPGELILEY